MQISIDVKSCKECPFKGTPTMYGGAVYMCNEVYRRKDKIVAIENIDIIPDFCPFKVHEYQSGAKVFKERLSLLLNEFQNVSIMSVADWVSEIEICDNKECIKTGTDDLNSKTI